MDVATLLGIDPKLVTGSWAQVNMLFNEMPVFSHALHWAENSWALGLNRHICTCLCSLHSLCRKQSLPPLRECRKHSLVSKQTSFNKSSDIAKPAWDHTSGSLKEKLYQWDDKKNYDRYPVILTNYYPEMSHIELREAHLTKEGMLASDCTLDTSVAGMQKKTLSMRRDFFESLHSHFTPDQCVHTTF